MNRRLLIALIMCACGNALAAEAPAGEVKPFQVDGMWVDPKPAPEESSEKVAAGRLSIGMLAETGQLASKPMTPSAATPAEARRAEQYLKVALETLQSGRPQEALSLLRDGLALNAQNPRLLAYAAILLAEQRDFERASEYFERYLALEPNEPGVGESYAAVLLRLARFEDAERLLKDLEMAHPDNLAIHFNQLILDFLRERRQQNPIWWNQRSKQEIQQLTRWLRSDEQGMIDLLGTVDFANVCGIVLGPNARDHLAEIDESLTAADTAWNGGDAVAARKAWTDASRYIEGYGLQEAIAMAAEEANDVDAALEIRIAQARRFPNWAPATLAHGQMVLRLGQRREALAIIRAARNMPGLDPNFLDFAFAGALALNGQHSEAQEIFMNLVRKDPQNFKKWVETDPALRAGFMSVPNHAAILRLLDVPPELQ